MRRLATPLLLLALLAVAGCEDNSTEPGRTLTFSGTFNKDNIAAAQEHPFAIDTSSNVRIRLSSATLNVPGSAPVNGALIIGLGRPGVVSGVTTCVPSNTILYAVGDVGSHGLRSGSYCLSIRAGVTLPETPAGSTELYSVNVEITD